ncbi:MAG: hypothetical protein NTX05_07275 [Fusobacteria bacterium]|nr:hypothetical protein [Fusobacteriota bacterium]
MDKGGNDFEGFYCKPQNAPWSYAEIPIQIQELISKSVLKKTMEVLEIDCDEGHNTI